MPEELSLAAVILTLGAGFLELLRRCAKWLGKRLFAEIDPEDPIKKPGGYITRLVDGQIKMMTAIETVPDSIKQIQAEGTKQTEILEKIAENQEIILSNQQKEKSNV